MVGILVSFWDGLCSGAMLILGSVPPWKLTEELKTHHLKMYFLLKMVIFRPVMLVFRCTRRSFMPWNPTKKIPFSPSLPEDVFPGQWNDEGEDNIHKLGFSQSIRCCCSVRSTRCTYSKKSKAFFRALRWAESLFDSQTWLKIPLFLIICSSSCWRRDMWTHGYVLVYQRQHTPSPAKRCNKYRVGAIRMWDH